MNSENLTNTPLAIKKLQGIKPKGVKVKDSSKLEKLIEIGNSIMTRFVDSCSEYSRNEDSRLHPEIVKILKTELLSEFEFNTDDLISFVHAKSGVEGSETELKILGFYSGALLSMLTEKNIWLNQKTRVHINGEGNSFPYLFSYAQYIDEIIIENFKGKQVCNNISQGESKANLIVFANMCGNEFGWRAGEGKKIAKSVYFINNDFGEEDFPYVYAKTAWFINNNHDSFWGHVGSGNTNDFWLLNNQKKGIMVKGLNEYVDTLFVVNHPFTNIGSMGGANGRKDNSVKNLVLCCDPEDYVEFKDIKFNNISMGAAANKKYESIVELSHSLIGEKDTLKIIDASKKIKQLYSEINEK
ncbi:hypothetical protein HOK51_07770 [Candidatus Woesearchaeota archaeon]|jgi:hypothetical protein|nr:hypothetical protein [Candidatus Woesearchaeota archaeon]MBT6519722.1 hypothetical protein [Candidatus Woesearchaeota archaeon]MBT7368102.1 hypothetical protein [Candidatus Woesearchaeota archaeon]